MFPKWCWLAESLYCTNRIIEAKFPDALTKIFVAIKITYRNKALHATIVKKSLKNFAPSLAHGEHIPPPQSPTLINVVQSGTIFQHCFLGGGREEIFVITSALENFILRFRQGNVLTFLSKIISIKALSVYHRILCWLRKCSPIYS